MNGVVDFVRQLLENGAFGQRIVIGASDAQSVASSFDVHDIEAICRFAIPTDPWSIRLTFFGQRLHHSGYTTDGFFDFRKIERLHRGGATVIVNRVHDYSGSIYRLKQRLEARLRCHVGVNCYATPMKCQGFATHVDDHDVVVVQIQGRKQWNLFERAPRANGEYTMAGLTQREPTRQPILAPGDLLYMPVGFAHSAKSVEDAASLHLTFGFRPPTLKTLLTNWINAAAKENPALNDVILPTMLRASAEDEWRRLAERALRSVTGASLDAARREMTNEHRDLDAESADDGDICLAAVTPETPLCKARGATGRLFGGALRLRDRHGRVLHLRPGLAGAYTAFDEAPVVHPRDLANRVPDGHATLFCYYLLSNRLVEFAESPRPA